MGKPFQPATSGIPNMLNWLSGTPPLDATASELYGRVVTAARQSVFYRDLGVPDTPEGRYEMLAIHLFLGLERVNQERDHGKALAQRVIETFITDMDDCMREMGVGDTVVPKRVKRAAAGFYERAQVYRTALQQGDNAALSGALQEAIAFQNKKDATSAAKLAQYMREGAARMAVLPSAGILKGRVEFPPVKFLE